jgi:hypothetical protein
LARARPLENSAHCWTSTNRLPSREFLAPSPHGAWRCTIRPAFRIDMLDQHAEDGDIHGRRPGRTASGSSRHELFLDTL